MRKPVFIALVCRTIIHYGDAVVQRTAFTGTDREAVIQRAITERAAWHKTLPGRYRIFAGVLVSEIVEPSPVTVYTEVFL
jgi:hypothetical protein